jgi:hypothetical protein
VKKKVALSVVLLAEMMAGSKGGRWVHMKVERTVAQMEMRKEELTAQLWVGRLDSNLVK